MRDSDLRSKIVCTLSTTLSGIPPVLKMVSGMSTAFWEQLDYSLSVLSQCFDFSILDAGDSSCQPDESAVPAHGQSHCLNNIGIRFQWAGDG